MANDPRIEAAHPALEGRLRMYLADRADGAVGWGASVPEIVEVVLTATDAVDPLRALLADEERAVELLVCADQRWTPVKFQRWRHTSTGQQAVLRARDVLAARRSVAD